MRKNYLLIGFMTLIILLSGLTFNTLANDLNGREIMEKVYNRNTGEDRKAELNMRLVNKFDDKRERDLKQFNRDFGKVEKKIMFFTSPQDIRGTSFMNWSYEDEREDSQWIYLPALRKIKRISAENKSDYFMGSDFTYDDLGERKVDEDSHKLIGNEKVNGEECYIVENIPKEDYMYSKTITWVSKDKWIGLKKEFYDNDGKLLKILTVKDYEKIDGIVTITHSEMYNKQKDHKTILKLDNVEYNTGISEDKFTERQMKMGI
ncbi:MAG: outer membrane lipoprotein-sorting protein [Halanaerobiales bacterium]|nr:outer membrane lipoprotein-sorting protein [Halanaerobiales bacterium]